MKLLQNFETFSKLNEMNQANTEIIKDYDFEVDEIVTLKHKSWSQSYDFRVVTGGLKPTFKQVDGGREIEVYRPEGFDIILPEKLRPMYRTLTRKVPVRKVKEKIPMITTREYIKLCKDIAHSGNKEGREEYDHSEFYDMAENQVITDDSLKNYLRKQIEKEDPDSYKYYFPSDKDCIEKMVNDLESYS